MQRHAWRHGRQWLAGLLAAGPLFAPAMAAGDYPSRPVRIVVPFAAGGSTDLLARQVAAALGRATSQSFVVENRPGGSGDVGATQVARAPNDGYTLLFTTTNLTANAAEPQPPGYDPVKDFTAVTMVAFAPMLLVTAADSPASSVPELVSAIKTKPGKYNYSSSGTGGAPHLAGVLFARRAGLEVVHVPYNGALPALTDVAAGHVQFSFTTYVSAEALVSAKRLKVLAVAGSGRLKALPEVSTLAQSGVPDVEIGTMFGLLGPAGMPAAHVRKLYEGLRQQTTAPGFRQGIEAMGADLVLSEPATYSTYLRNDVARWKTLLNQVGDVR